MRLEAGSSASVRRVPEVAASDEVPSRVGFRSASVLEREPSTSCEVAWLPEPVVDVDVLFDGDVWDVFPELVEVPELEPDCELPPVVPEADPVPL